MFGIAAPAHASYRFTYNSQPIPWNFSVQNDNDFIDIGSGDMPDFSLVFDAPNSWLHATEPTEFVMPTPTIRLWNETAHYTIIPNDGNAVAMTDNGQIFGWRFGFEFVPVFGPDADPLTVATNKIFSIYSTANMGASCPCDNVTISMNDVAMLNGQPVSNGSILINYRGVNQFAPTWTIAPVSAVPEPESMWMMFGGLSLLGWLTRRRDRNVLIRQS